MEDIDIMKKFKIVVTVSFVIILLASFFTIGIAYAQGTQPSIAKGQPIGDLARGDAFLAIAISVGAACLAAGYAVGKVGAAAIGAATEKPEIFGRAIIFVGLAEGIAIYGLIIAIMLLGKV